MPIVTKGKPVPKKLSPAHQSIVDMFGFVLEYYPGNKEWVGRLSIRGKPVVTSGTARSTIAVLVGNLVEENPSKFLRSVASAKRK